MPDPFADHFAPVSSAYADFRPTYPAELFAWLAQVAPGRELAWDCACGSGQASVDLARHFRRVVATDASAAQLAAAVPHPAVTYRQAGAEASGLPAASVDLVSVAQALHWLPIDAFHAEVGRILRPGGILAVWSYGPLSLADDRLDAALQRFYWDVVGPYWPAERRHVENGYRDLSFPFPELDAPPLAMSVAWDLPHLLGYVRSWSASSRCLAATGADPVAALAAALAPDWGPSPRHREVRWPLALRVGRRPDDAAVIPD